MSLCAVLPVAGCRSRAAGHGGEDGAAPAATEEPASASGAEVSDASAYGTTIAALRSPTPIFTRPEIPPRDPTRTADETVQAIVVGSLRKGTRVAARPAGRKGPGCAEGWFELQAGGYVCGRFVTTDLASKELQDAPHVPFADRPLPYDYGLNLTNGTPVYRRPPLRRERAEYEKGLLQAAKSAEERAAVAREVTAETGQTPWYLSDDPRHASLDDTSGEGALVLRRMMRGFYVALDQQVHAFAGKFWRTARGGYIPLDHVLVHKSTTEYEGVWVGHDDEPRKLPLGFVLRPLARQYDFDDLAERPRRTERVERFTIVPLTGKKNLYEQRAYYETTEGWWLKDTDGTVTRPGPPPPDLAPSEKWIDVNLTTQTLVAFEGTRPVFATLVSTGRHDDEDPARDHRTPTGAFRIREKHVSTTMDDDSATDGPYSIEDVPWVMYFDKGYALHGAFWHSGFGREHSHGCVNINPHDARQIFEWVGPTLPAGWHAVRATHDNPGTRVVVHDESEKPDAGRGRP